VPRQTMGDVVNDGPPDLNALQVRVLHGSLEHASYRLLVGHFQGLPISGAEAQLNKRSDGRLERMLLMQQYPQRLGDILVLEPLDEAPPRGAVIIGLGPSGELAAAQLRDVVTRSLLRVALIELERRLAGPPPADGRWSPLGVSSVLIGSSSGGGLRVEASVRALIDGTIAANGRLTRMKVLVAGEERFATDVVSVEALELIERYEDRVDLIVGVLARLQALDGRTNGPDPAARQQVNYVLEPSAGEGRSSAGSPIDAADEVWRRIDIRATSADTDAATVELEFTSIGRLARAERLVGLAERTILDPLVASAIGNDADPDIGGTLYELLIPNELKGELGSGEHLHLLVDENTADYPWELMRPRSDEPGPEAPLALRVGILRQFRETESVRFEVRRASGNNALVIGNPPAPGFEQLESAYNESVTVSEVLGRSGWNVESLIWDTTGTFDEAASTPVTADGAAAPASYSQVTSVRALHRLLNGDWRVVHIAAHGQFTDDPTTTGVVLGNLRLTANVFAKMSVIPDLVVLNACHLGRVLTGANRVAASVGRELLRAGVRAVVVAGWAVADTAARSFSEHLYSELLTGADFGTAVSGARHAAWNTERRSVTWGAYQCYGDPGFCLTTRSYRRDLPAVYTVGELRRRVQRLIAIASDQGRSATSDAEGTASQLRSDLRDLQARAMALRSPEALADVADAWAELLEFRSAIRLYRLALQHGGSDVTIRSIEQLGNLLSRRAQQLHRRGVAETWVDVYVKRAHTRLTTALELGPTGERLALMGGFHKRLATMTTGVDRARHLGDAIRFFAEAQRIRPKAYHELNWIQLVQVAKLNNLELDESAAVFEAAARALQERVREAESPQSSPVIEAEAAPDFWTRAGIGDLRLSDLLVRAASDSSGPEALEEAANGITAAYVAAFRLRSSARERDSVTTHLRDLVDIVPAGTDTARILHDVHGELRSWTSSESRVV
jgi:CHAT domain